MTRRAAITNSLSKGVLDPGLSERIDLPHYYNGLESALNVEIFPQGGLRRRAGTSAGPDGAARLRRRIVPLEVTAAMLAAPNGGTKANLIDQNAATALITGAVSGSIFVLFEIDLGTAADVCFIDVTGYSCAAGRFPGKLAAEYWDGSAWVAFWPNADGARKLLDTDLNTRRWGLQPGQIVSARSWRVVVYDGAGAGAVTVSGVRLWREKRQLSPADGDSFARASDVVYEWTLTERNIDIWRDRVWQAAVSVDIAARQIGDITTLQSLDTLAVYHEDLATPVIQRRGGNGEWHVEPAVYTNVPALTPGTAFAGDQDEIQDLRLPGLAAGDRLVLWLEGAVTAPLTYAPTTFAADVEAALQAIGVGSGLVASDLGEPSPGLRLSFLGNAGARRWPVLQAAALDRDDLDPVTTIVQRGLDGGGPIIGVTTGYPRCGVVTQERQIVCGMRAAPLSYGVSRYGLQWDFQDDADPLTADLGFFGTLNADMVDLIEQVYVGRHICFFTTSGEWYAESRTIDATQPFNVNFATRAGIRGAVPAIFADGAVSFIDRGGRTLRDFVYSDVELSYKAEPLTLLGPHLLTDVVDVGYRAARSTSEGNQVFIVNADGSIAFMPLLRSQEVVATAPWSTDGRFKLAFGDVQARVFLVVERETLDGADLYLEKLDGTHTLDAAVTPTDGLVRSQVTGLGHLEGKDVWAWVDRDLVGPMRVSGGVAMLPAPGVVAACGLFPPLRARLPTLREKLQNGYPWRPPARIFEVDLALAGTGQIDVAVNGGPFRDVPLTFDGSRALDIGAAPPRDTTGVGGPSPVSASLERLLRAVCMIPASGEFAYATDVVTRTANFSGTVTSVGQNMHNTSGQPDVLVSLGQLRSTAPNVRRVSLFTGWFGSDLRAGDCVIQPKVDFTSDPSWVFTPYDWSVSDLDRASAETVSSSGGHPAYGGTPSDRSVVDLIQEMKAQGQAVVLTPFLMMDVPAGNALANPYGGSSQPAYPWRGRITCHPAPGQPGTPDLTATAAAQVASFVGTVVPADFTVTGNTVFYDGPDEWSYRRFILHHAALAKAAGGVDTFVIGSEMRGLTWVRSALGVYPFVTALAALAADVKAMLGGATKVTYAADWSELPAHQTGVPGECFFHLDALWASSAIDAVGVDNYLPLADWRDGTAHADWVAGWRSIYDTAYLQSNIAGGEYFDWYYADGAARDAQTRTPIADGAYGKHWVWRAKDHKGWWSNQHFNRPAGTESATATAWVPQSKPIWFMEVGCGAVDKGANQPNVFVDPKSSENALPHYSAGRADPAMQRAFLEALLRAYTPGQAGFGDELNPVSTVYGGRMVDHERITAYTWDARFFPGFPELVDVWADGDLWTLGHWLTGRLKAGADGSGDSLPVGLSPELPMRDRLVTGTVRVTNLRGFSRHPTIEISQSKPAPLELRGIRYEVVHHG